MLIAIAHGVGPFELQQNKKHVQTIKQERIVECVILIFRRAEHVQYFQSTTRSKGTCNQSVHVVRKWKECVPSSSKSLLSSL